MDESKLNKIILLLMENDSLYSRIFRKVFQKKVFSKFKNLSKNQPQVIRIIGIEDEIMTSTIGEYIWMNKSALTHMVDDLENKGLVYRKNDPEDRRKVLVSLTSKGLECYDDLYKITAEMADEIFEQIDEDELDEFIKSLETIFKVLKKVEERGNVRSKMSPKCLKESPMMGKGE